VKYGIGFKFNDKHSRDFSIVAKSDDRSLLPEKRRNEFVIPGRDGALDYGNNTYHKRIITVQIAFATHNFPDLRAVARLAAHWLSGAGLLIFDDEPDKAYRAKVYQPLAIAQLASTGQTTVPFDCNPFAESPHYNQITETFTDNPHETLVTPKGTQDTPCLIYIKNIGTTDISKIKLTRKADG
jgi:predicted phage tail component-like protein